MPQFKSVLKILAITLLLFLFVDVFICRLLLNWGFMLDFGDQKKQRYDFPYVEFRGQPDVLDHNEMGYRGRSIREASDSAFRILFFAGSTGYYGDPAIPQILEQKLSEAWGRQVFVANCSVVSSNHRQHLHALIEFFIREKADMVIFYGGYNENILPLNYDPRPGYPFNYYYKHECPSWRLFLIQYSAIFGEAEKRMGIISGIRWLKSGTESRERKWHQEITDMYFRTLSDASLVTESMIRNGQNKPCRFMAFYQPYRVNTEFAASHDRIRQQIRTLDEVYDLSSCLDSIAAVNEGIYYDNVHVSPEANLLIAGEMAGLILKQVSRADDHTVK